jgi:glycosyltransferase involved in cell wall biosynthesis
MKPKVSIIIACFNDSYVEKAVFSARNQEYENKEVILVDDGSIDEVKSLIESLKGKVDILIQQPNSGQSIARNNGIKKASGKYILNHDSDDFFDKNYTFKAVELMERDSNIKIVTCKANRVFNNEVVDVFTPAGGDFENFLYSNAALGSSMFRKADWSICGGYEEELPILGFEDWEFYLNILKRGGVACVLDEVLFNYRLRENSITRKISDLRIEKFRQIILKHQELYKERFEDTVNHLFSRIENMERERMKLKQGVDYKTGNRLLQPLRYLKRKF